MEESGDKTMTENGQILVNVSYYADGFYTGVMRFTDNILLCSEIGRRAYVLQVIRKRHPQAEKIDIITAKILQISDGYNLPPMIPDGRTKQ